MLEKAWGCLAGLRAGDGPLSVRVRPSSLKRDRARRATSTGGTCRVHVHARSRLTPETSADTPARNHGTGRACPDRTRAIPCTVRAVTGPHPAGTGGAPPRTWPTHFGRVPSACPRDAPEPPSTANDRHQQQPANMKLAEALDPQATHGNTLVMRRSLGVSRRTKAPRCKSCCVTTNDVPDWPVNAGNLRVTPGQPDTQAQHKQADPIPAAPGSHDY
jgi:hypothetical protein